jgi:hypothetical protein
MGNLPTVNAFWVGPQLGKMHAACLQSFARQGHHVVLHTYDPPPEDTPKGVEIADASVLLSRDKVIQHKKSGSLALAADLFRYELMVAEAGVYVDCDCYCVRPLPDTDYLFGWESGRDIAVGVLKLPPDSPLTVSMRAIGSMRGFIPPWEKPNRKIRYRMFAAFGLPVPIEKMKWGTMGPVAFTYYARQFSLDKEAQPIDEYYPVNYYQCDLLRDSGLQLQDLITPRTKVVHLWNEVQRKIDMPPPPGSPLAMICESLSV